MPPLLHGQAEAGGHRWAGRALRAAVRAPQQEVIELLKILLVCTANQCRSPMAEAMLRARLAEGGVKATIRSAGAGRLPGGQPATDNAIAELAGRGLDLSKHRSRILDNVIIGGADLIICMTRDHVRAVADIDPAALDRTFTLKDLVRRAGHRAPDQSVADWVRLLAESRQSSDVLGIGDDGIDDPIGQGPVAYTKCADELAALLDELASKLAPADAP